MAAAALPEGYSVSVCCTRGPDSKSWLSPSLSCKGAWEKESLAFFRISSGKKALRSMEKHQGNVLETKGGYSVLSNQKRKMSMTLGHILCRCIQSHTSPGLGPGMWELSGQIWLHGTTTHCTTSTLTRIFLGPLLFHRLWEESGRDAGSVLFPLHALLAVLGTVSQPPPGSSAPQVSPYPACSWCAVP